MPGGGCGASCSGVWAEDRGASCGKVALQPAAKRKRRGDDEVALPDPELEARRARLLRYHGSAAEHLFEPERKSSRRRVTVEFLVEDAPPAPMPPWQSSAFERPEEATADKALAGADAEEQALAGADAEEPALAGADAGEEALAGADASEVVEVDAESDDMDNWGDWDQYGKRWDCKVTLRPAKTAVPKPPSAEPAVPPKPRPWHRRPPWEAAPRRPLRTPERHPTVVDGAGGGASCSDRHRRVSFDWPRDLKFVEAAGCGASCSDRRRRDLVEWPRVPRAWAPQTPPPSNAAPLSASMVPAERPMTNSDRRRSERRRKAELMGGPESLLRAYIEGRWEAITTLLSAGLRRRGHRLWRESFRAPVGGA